MPLLLLLYLTFLKIGTFAFGGGLAMLPLIEKELIYNTRWITNSDFLNIVTISQITPGPIAVNAATYVGFNVSNIGIKGSIMATLGVVTTSFVLSVLCTHFLKVFNTATWLKAILKGLKPILVAMIFAAFITVSKSTYIIDEDLYKTIILSILALFLSFKMKLNPIIIILICAILGVIIF